MKGLLHRLKNLLNSQHCCCCCGCCTCENCAGKCNRIKVARRRGRPRKKKE